MMEYKGYQATVEYDDEADLFHGEVINTRTVITFQGRSVDDLRRELAESVEDYLEWCAERGKEPEKPYSGKLLVRATPELHRAVATAAAREHQSVNAWVTRTLAQAANSPEEHQPRSQTSRLNPARKHTPRPTAAGRP